MINSIQFFPPQLASSATSNNISRVSLETKNCLSIWTILAAYLVKKDKDLGAQQAIARLRNIRGESIQSKDQERIVYGYEEYLKKSQDQKRKQENGYTT
jgi:hypothetical protein